MCVCVCVCVCSLGLLSPPWYWMCERQKANQSRGGMRHLRGEWSRGRRQKSREPPAFHACSLQERVELRKVLHTPGIEPGPAAWKAVVLPLHHVCAGFNGCKHTSLFCSLGKLVTNSPTVGVFLSSGWRRGRAERRHGDQEWVRS